MGRKRKQADFTKQEPWIEDHVAAASLAYKDWDYTEPQDKIQMAQAWQHYKTIDSPMGLRCKVWISPENGNVMVGFRGTQSLQEMKVDATLGHVPFKTGKNEVVGQVYKGFGDAFVDMLPALEDNLRFLRATDFIPQGATLQFAGHSLGGAMSDLAATYFADAYPDVQVIQTGLGQPTTGDSNYVAYAQQQKNVERTRILAPGDPVANVRLPGMKHVEMNNVIVVDNASKKGKTISDVFKKVLNDAIPGAGDALGIADAGKNNHSLTNYETQLSENFTDTSIQSVDDPNFIARREEEAAQALAQSDVPVSVADCNCDCHIFDASIQQGDPPPPSLGATVEMAAPGFRNVVLTTPAFGTVSTSVNDNVDMTPTQNNLYKQQQQNRDLVNALPQDIAQSINDALMKAQQNDAQKLQKLEDQYAQLTNANTGNVDPTTFERTTIQRQLDGLNYMQNRVDMEIQYPQYVPNDPDGSTASRDAAIAFKNRLNSLYSEIMQAATDNRSRSLDPTTVQEDKTRDFAAEMATDQFKQIDQAAKDNDLNPDEQPSGYVFDIKQLGDNFQTADDAKLFQTWLDYPGMTPQDLYNDLKDQYVQDYQNNRISQYRDEENKWNQTYEQSLKQQIEDQSKNLDANDQSRTTFMFSLANNKDFQQQLESGKINLSSVLEEYKGKDSEDKIMQSILGYTHTTQQEEENTYATELRDLQSKHLPEDQYDQALKELQLSHEIIQDNPWLDSGTLKPLISKYKDDYVELDKQIEKMRDAHWNRAIPEGVDTSNPFAIDVNLNKHADYNVNASAKIQQGDFQDDYATTQAKLWQDYADPTKRAALFKQWNQVEGGKTSLTDTIVGSILNPFSAPSRVDHYLQDKKSGWFDKDGNNLGFIASPDFAAFAQAHPELGFTHKGPEYTQGLDVMSKIGEGIVQGYEEKEFGTSVNPTDLTNMLDNAAGEPPPAQDKNGNGVPDDLEANYTSQDNPMQRLLDGIGLANNAYEQYSSSQFWMRGSNSASTDPSSSSSSKEHPGEDGIRGETNPPHPRSTLFSRARTHFMG